MQSMLGKKSLLRKPRKIPAVFFPDANVFAVSGTEAQQDFFHFFTVCSRISMDEPRSGNTKQVRSEKRPSAIPHHLIMWYCHVTMYYPLRWGVSRAGVPHDDNDNDV